MGWMRERGRVAEWCVAGLLALGGTTAVQMRMKAQTASTVATTLVSDTVVQADGTGATGTLLINWGAFTTAGGSGIPAGQTSVTLGAGGALSVNLVPNAGATPVGTYYTVVYHLGDGSTTREYWVVPATAAGNTTGVKLAAIRNTVVPTSVAMQTVSKSYVDMAIAAAVTGHPADSNTPYVLKAGDTMTGALVLPGDPTAPLQASDKNYVDTQIAAVTAGVAQKVSTLPAGTQVVTQPAGTDLETNRLNGVAYASQYVSGAGNNGIANATASTDCANGCTVVAEPTYGSTEAVAPLTWKNGTHVVDQRSGARLENYVNPQNQALGGQTAGAAIDLKSTESAQSVFARTGSQTIFSTSLVISSEGLTGGSNQNPELLQGTEPYGKTTYSALNLSSSNNTEGQHILVPQQQDCYGVGDCLVGSAYIRASGGFRDDGDEGTHPYDREFAEDARVFTGTCSTGCATGATVLQVTATANPGTQGDGRYLIDKNPAKLITAGQLIGGTQRGGIAPVATFQGTNFAVSTLLETAQTIPTQANDLRPGTVTVPIVTSGAPAGYATSTAALPSTSGVACVADSAVVDARPINFETAAYTVVDGSHVRLTLRRPHAGGATIAVGGLCGYGLEQTVDTVSGIRQVFPVIGSTSATSLIYAGASTPIAGISGDTSAFTNINLVIASIARTNNVVTVTTAGNFPADVNGLTMTVQGVTDTSYNGSFAVTTTGPNTLTYAQAGANSTSASGAVTLVTGGYVLYPMAEVVQVYNATTKAVDGQMTLAANTVAWAAGDAVEQPHYYQEWVSADTDLITQYTPRGSKLQSAGITYAGTNGPGLTGFAVTNAMPAASYFGNGGTHTVPNVGMSVAGAWHHAMELQAGEDAAVEVHCNSHGCNAWNSAYDLLQMDTSVGVDRMNYQPATSTLNLSLRGTSFQFNPLGMTAGTINTTTLNATTVNAGTVHGAIAASSLPVFAASGTAHAAGAVPDPGATAGTTRYLREDGTWASNVATMSASAVQNLPQRGSLLGEYLLTEGTGTVAHDTSGNGNNGTVSGAAWEGSAGTATDLNFTTLGGYVQVPAALNAAKAWQFALYLPSFGTNEGPAGMGYGGMGEFGANPSILCGTDTSHLCLIANSTFWAKGMRFFAFNTDNTESAEPMSPGWHVLTLLCGSNVNGTVTKTRMLFDGAEVGGYLTQGDANTCPAPTSGNYQIGGSSQYNQTFFVGKIAATWAWGTNLSLSDGVTAANSALEYLRAKGVTVSPRKPVSSTPLVLAGLDSRTYGVQLAPGQNWLAQMTLTDATYVRMNFGVPGQGTLDGCNQFEATYGQQVGTNAGPVITVLWGGVNDYDHLTTRQTANGLRCMVQKAKAMGSRVILATEISSHQSTNGDVDKNALNAILRQEAFGWGVDDLADLATDVHIGADNAWSNTNCFVDGTHPGATCEPYITSVMQDAVNELLGSTETMHHQTAAASYQELAGDRYLDLTGTGAQAVTLPSCTGYSLTRQVLNLGSAAATVSAVSGQTLAGNTSIAAGTRGVFLPVPGAGATAGCTWERTQ